MKKNDMVTVDITDINTDGAGVGRADGMAVFVPGLLPGERAGVRIIKLAKNYAVGRCEAIITPSPDRVEPECAYARRCGGCTLRHMAYPAQLALKTNRVREALKRIGGIVADVEPCVPSPETNGFRNKASFPVGRAGGAPACGLYAARSHDIIDIDACISQDGGVNAVLGAVREWMTRYGVAPYDEAIGDGLVRHIVARNSDAGQVSACLVINGDALTCEAELVQMLREGVPGLCEVAINVNRSRGNAIMGNTTRVIWGGGLTETFGGYTFTVSPSAFLQVNSAQARTLYDCAMECAEIRDTDTVLDLYCGIGTMTLMAARRAKDVIGIEISRAAVDDAVNNARRNDVRNVRFICADAGGLADEKLRADIVIVDPPRKGIERTAVDTIIAMSPRRIVCVSCDPATMARDAALFAAAGYAVSRVCPHDMFPHTTHVETVCLLSKLHAEHHIEAKSEP